jgi:uncharacterized protein (DUF952 family)
MVALLQPDHSRVALLQPDHSRVALLQSPPGRPDGSRRRPSRSGRLDPVAGLLLHLITAADWDTARAHGSVDPAPGGAFVHLSTPDQVTLPANRLFAGRTDLLLLTVDPAGLDVRLEPGMPDDPPGMAFPHAYGPVPVSAVVSVQPYRPKPDGTFPPPP